MPSPPKWLERIVGWMLPPACREEIAGDSFERYKSPVQYIVSAVRVIPFVIFSRIRRTVDAPHLFSVCLLEYAAMLVAAWWFDKPFLYSDRGLWLLFLPSLQTLILTAVEKAWQRSKDQKPSWWSSLLNALINICVLFRILPAMVLIFGSLAAIVILTAFESLTPSSPPVLARPASGLENVRNRSITVAAVMIGVVLLSAILLVTIGMKPRGVALIILLEAISVGNFLKEPK